MQRLVGRGGRPRGATSTGPFNGTLSAPSSVISRLAHGTVGLGPLVGQRVVGNFRNVPDALRLN